MRSWVHKAIGAVQRAVHGPAPTDRPASLAEIPLVGLDGTPVGGLSGRVLLIVNVASRCGFTSQYAGLQALSDRFKGAGLTVIGVPCNQFLGQEPGTAEEIATFCSTTFGVDFPLLEKADVNGPGRSALYRWLIGSAAGRGEEIGWNFEKFLVDRTGEVVARFAPSLSPDDPALVQAVERALA